MQSLLNEGHDIGQKHVVVHTIRVEGKDVYSIPATTAIAAAGKIFTPATDKTLVIMPDGKHWEIKTGSVYELGYKTHGAKK